MGEVKEKKVLSLRIVIDDALEKRFSEIKDELGLNSNAEVIRFLINKYYKQMIEKGSLACLFLLKLLGQINLLSLEGMEEASYGLIDVLQIF